MLSALAKYIFGGVMGDAPETTSMQYETREINDWLLVDMPDQDIDNEDMDSESDDDDDILTAVPLLLAEEVSVSPRQIVLSYEPDSSCDKSCVKIRKGYQDKIHSSSSKVQVHTGDKIQGNFVANVQAISLETGDISHDKVQHNLSEVQENVKSKQSKSKNSKPKKSKKNKINKKCTAKMQDTSVVIKKKCKDYVQEKLNKDDQEKLNDTLLLNLKEEIEHVSNVKPENVGTENEYKLVEKVESGHTVSVSNSNLKNADKVEGNSHATIIDNFSEKNADKNDFHIAMKDDSSHNNKNASGDFLESYASKVKRNTINEASKNSDKIFESNATIVENNVNSVGKRSYADVVKAKCDTFDKDDNKEVLDDNKIEQEFPEISLHDEAQNIQLDLKDNIKKPELKHNIKKPKDKKNKSKIFIKNSMQNDANMKSQSISVSVNYQDEAKGNKDDSRDLLGKIAIIPSQFQENSDKIKDNFNAKNVFDRDTEKINVTLLDTCLVEHQNIAEEVLKNYTGKVLEDIGDKMKPEISQMQLNCEIIKDSFTDTNEAVLIDVSENFKSRLQGMSDVEESEDIFMKNLTYNNAAFQNETIQEDSINDIYFNLSHNTENENIANFIDNCMMSPREVSENYQDKAQHSSESQQNLDDRVLENIADLWDIYTKIQDNSDDEIHEISDDEMNENFCESFFENSDKNMNENSDEQMTDDEMNENSQDDYEEISDDEIFGRSCSKILQNFFGEENAKLYNKVFEYNLDEESEESDNELFINRLILPPVASNMERKAEFLQPFKCDFFEELKQNASEIPKHHSSCVPLTEYELVEYFNFEPQYVYACQSLQYPSSYALAIAEYYSNHDQYFPKYSERCNAFIQKYKRRAIVDNQTPSAPSEPSLITNTAEILEKIINQKCSVLPTKTAVVLEHVKDLKPVQQAIQYEARKYLTRSQLNRQNRNYIYQASSKTNRRRNLQRNHSGVNNNRKCC